MMDSSQWRHAINFDGALICATAPETLHLAVPSCPEWTVRDLIVHLGAVHRWAATFLAQGPDSRERLRFDTSDVPDGPAVTTWYRDRLAELVAQLGQTDPGSPARTFAGAGTARFWFRRQAHETSMHRWDVENALPSGAAAIQADLATDGVGEWLEVFAPRFLARGPGLPASAVGATVLLSATDSGAVWPLRLAEQDIDHDPAAEPDVVVGAPASDLMLALWRRIPLARLRIEGDAAVIAALLDAVRVT